MLIVELINLCFISSIPSHPHPSPYEMIYIRYKRLYFLQRSLSSDYRLNISRSMEKQWFFFAESTDGTVSMAKSTA